MPETDADIHVMPADEGHEDSRYCWCAPREIWQPSFQRQLWVHRSWFERMRGDDAPEGETYAFV